MRRFILTGISILALSASSFSLATADETTPALTVPAAVSSVASTGMVTSATSTVAPNADVSVAPNGDSEDASLPTEGADLVMWNATPALPPATVSQADLQAAPRANRLRRFASGIVSRTTAIASSLTRSAMRFIGTPYVFGGTRASGFDCSGYVQHVFAMVGIHLPRTADAQFDAARKIQAAMAPGDLVFFHTYAPGVSHVGIYLGNSRFIHSASHGVSISSLHDAYWAPRYLGAKRVFGS